VRPGNLPDLRRGRGNVGHVGGSRARGTFFVCRIDYPNDRVYAENVTEFLALAGVKTQVIELARDGQRPELEQCLVGDAIGVLGLNAELDHSWISSSNFLDLAEDSGVPVIHWMLDHPSSRWHQFGHTTVSNSRFLFLSEFSRRYFNDYVFRDCASACTMGVGPSRYSRLRSFSRASLSPTSLAAVLRLSFKVSA
jgi:hypothetical protein